MKPASSHRSGSTSNGHSGGYCSSPSGSHTQASGKHFPSNPKSTTSSPKATCATNVNVPGSEECIPISKISKCLPKLVQCYNALCNPQRSCFPPPGMPPFCFEQKTTSDPPNMNVNIFRAPPHSVLADILKESVRLNQGTVATEKCKCVIINPLNPIQSIALNHNKQTDQVSVSRIPKPQEASTVFSPQFQNCHFYNIGTDNQKEKAKEAKVLDTRAESLSPPLRKRSRRNAFSGSELKGLSRQGSLVSNRRYGNL